MKKIELISVLFIWAILWAWSVWYLNKYPSLNAEKTITTKDNKQVKISGNIETNLNNLENQFKNISDNKTYVQLIKDPKYQEWVKNVNNLLESEKKQWNEDNVNYIYYNFTSNVVLKYLKDYTDLEKDLVIQSIRRIDFNTLVDKNYYTQLMKDYVDQKYYKPILEELKNVDAKKLDTDDAYFTKIMLDTQNGIFYRIFKNRYDWNKTWIGFKPEFLENQFVDFLSQRFEQILEKLWYNKTWFKKKVFEHYKIDSLEGLAKLINEDYENINKKYNLEKLWIPTDRFFRMDERRALFNNKELETRLYVDLQKQWKLEEFKKDVKELRLKMYLLSYLGKEINLFNHKVRAKFINPEGGPGIQNIFRIWRYVDEVYKLDLKPQVK